MMYFYDYNFRSMKVLLPFLFILFSIIASAQPVQLRYNLKPGSIWTYKQTELTSALAQSNDGRSTKFDKKTTRYFTLEIEEAGISGVQYRFRQDTAVVEDRDAAVSGMQTDPENILTRKPVRVRISPSGKVESTTPTVPLRVEALLGLPGGDAMFAQRAAVLPYLPTRTLGIGDTWTESTSDTLYPSKELPQIGRGNGIRHVSNATTYTVEERSTKMGVECLKIRWRGTLFLEEKILFSSLEEYSEDQSSIDGTLYVAIDTGMPIELEVRSEKENTRALFGGQNTVIPSSISTITTLEFIPQ
jgi:hypothetical protein